MRKLVVLLFIFSAFQAVLRAQEEGLFMHYIISPVLVNPAAAGFNEAYQLQANARSAWTGFADAPQTAMVRYTGPVGKTFGLGVAVSSERAAQLSRTKLHLDYAFRYQLNEDWKMAFGFFTAFQRMRIGNEATSGSFFDPSDITLEELLNGKNEFDAAVGVYGTFRENTFGGLTVNNLVSSRLSNIAGVDNSEGFFSFYTFNLGHRLMVSKDKVSLEPSIMLRQLRQAPFQMDLNLKAGFLNDQLIAGLSYRSLGAMGLLLGTKLDNFNLYYSYDVSFQRFQKYNTGSHEVTVAFQIKKKDKKPNE